MKNFLLVLALLSSTTALGKTFQMNANDMRDEYTIQGIAPDGYTVESIFSELRGRANISFNIASALMIYDITGGAKKTTFRRGEAFVTLYEIAKSNKNSTSLFMIGVSVPSKTLQGKYIFCESSANDKTVVEEIINICKSTKIVLRK